MQSTTHHTAVLIEKTKRPPTPNLRALRLAITTSDLLLSMGISASKVVSKALDITDAYCDYPVHFSITYDLITVSQMRNLESEPLTLIRPVTMRDVNNITIQAVQHLVYEIRNGKRTLDEAETELDRILTNPKAYPKWLIPLANALIAPAVALMFSTNWHIVVLTYIVALVVDRVLVTLARKSITPFFRQAAASMITTLGAAAIAWLAHKHIGFFVGMHPTLTVVSGIFMLVSGLSVVGSVQDALEEYYLTATARMLRVVIATAGIVVGVLIGLYIAKELHIGITVSPNPLSLSVVRFQLIGAAGAAGAFALATQTRLRAIAWAALIGCGSLATMYALRRLGFATIPATGVAAAAVAFVASLFSRIWRTPSSGIIAAGIIPLVPGLSLYTSLMQLVNYPPENPLFLRGVATLFIVIGTALAIAAGASLGSLLGRPLYRHVTEKRNILPFANLMYAQLHADTETTHELKK